MKNFHIRVSYFEPDAKVDLSFNGKYIAVLELSVKKLQVFHVHNQNLTVQGSDLPAAMFLHPLGEISKIYEIVSHDICWHLDALEYVPFKKVLCSRIRDQEERSDRERL